MSENKEKILLYYIYMMCFGIFIYIANREFIYKLFFTKDLKLTEIVVGFFLLIFYYFSIWIVNSWIINFIYVYNCKKLGYEILSYNFFPMIFIKTNNRKIKFSFSILLLHSIGSMIEVPYFIESEEQLERFIKNIKSVYLNVVRTHYYLIFFGGIIGIYNFSLGGMIIAYNIAVILYQSISNSSFWGHGYVYLSKNFNKESLIDILSNSLKVKNNNKKYIYNIFQVQALKMGKDTIIINQLYENIIIDSIADDYDYLDEDVRTLIDTKFRQYSYYNFYEFFKRYRLYRSYCLYVLNFYGKGQYDNLIKDFTKVYLNIKSIRIIKYLKMFEKDMRALEYYKFEEMDLKYKLDYCNNYEIYIEKLNSVKSKLSNKHISIGVKR